MSDMDLIGLPSAALYSIARNESAEDRYRKAAVRLMWIEKFPNVNHPDLAMILQEVKADLAAERDVTDIVEQAIEAPMPKAEETGPFKAGFTTRDM